MGEAVATDRVEIILTEKEVRKIEHIVRMRARYQEKRPSPQHQTEADYLHDLADKLERARLKIDA